jgi:hypothetical protein
MLKRMTLCLVLCSSCGVKNSVHFGETSKADLLQLKGAPLREETIPVKDSSLVIYENDETYQIKNGVVTNKFSNPGPDQKSLSWWKHKFKECKTELKRLPSSDSHIPSDMEFICAEEGIKVVYQEGNEIILKVVEYAKN